MITKIVEKIKDNEFKGAEIFSNISNDLQSFALAIHKTIKSKYPEAYEMTVEEYEEIDEEIQQWILTDEAIEINKKFQLESLSSIIIECIQGMSNLNKDKKEIEETILNILEKDNEDTEKNKSQE